MKVGLVAGEASGDLLGAGLIREIRRQVPGTEFEGVAGPAMQAAGCTAWEPAESLAVMGLVEPLRHLPRLLKLRRSLRMRWQESPPDVFVGIDAPDFNLGLELGLRQSGIRTVHYVSPSIWAWRPRRVRKIARAADRVLCLLPFEKPIYDQHGVDAVFVGHPMADRAPSVVDVAAARAALDVAGEPVIAVLPGSRAGEVSRLAGVLVATAKRIAANHPKARFVTPIATPALRPLMEAAVREQNMQAGFSLLDAQSQTAIAAADLVLLASGTAALETALLCKPMVAVYRVAPISYAILKGLRLVKLSHYTLPNLLTESPLVPEFIQSAAQPERIADSVLELLDDPDRCARISAEFAKLRDLLARDTDRCAAEAVLAIGSA